MSKVLHHNDGKGKWQSHEIYNKDLDHNFDMFLQGFGSTKEEAYGNFTVKLDEYILKLQEFRKEITIENSVKVDCLGKPI